MFSNFIKKSTIGMVLGALMFAGTMVPVYAQAPSTASQNQSSQEQIHVLLQLVATLQQMLLQLQMMQGNTVSKDTQIQGTAPEHTYVKINSVVSGPASIDLSSPLRDFSYEKPNSKTIDFRWKASNVPHDTQVLIEWERINLFSNSGPIGGGTWKGEIPRGASTGHWKMDINTIGTSDTGEYRARVVVLDKNTESLARSRWIHFKIIDEKNTERKNIKEKVQRENLTIQSLSLSLPNGIGHTSVPGYPVPDQKVTVVIKNNEFGRSDVRPRTVSYIATLYEFDTNGKRKKTNVSTAGEAMVPAGVHGSTEFEFTIKGGLPFDGRNFEKKYQILVDIDVTNVIEESSENDNRAWSKTWITSYYKG